MDWSWIVEWTFTDEWGRYNKDGDHNIKIFENKADMDDWLAEMRKHNGGYFQELFIGQADVYLYHRKMSLLRDAEAIGQLFEKSKIPWKENP